MNGLSAQELAILLATRESEDAKTLLEFAQLVETSPERIGATLDSLCAKGILECSDDDYIYPDNELAQEIFTQICNEKS
jgi:hypothetical protein